VKNEADKAKNGDTMKHIFKRGDQIRVKTLPVCYLCSIIHCGKWTFSTFFVERGDNSTEVFAVAHRDGLTMDSDEFAKKHPYPRNRRGIVRQKKESKEV